MKTESKTSLIFFPYNNKQDFKNTIFVFKQIAGCDAAFIVKYNN